LLRVLSEEGAKWQINHWKAQYSNAQTYVGENKKNSIPQIKEST